MGKTEIQWTNWSINPLRSRRKGSTATKGGYSSGVGHHCVKVSAGCRECYASETQPRFGLPKYQDQRNAGIETFLDATKLGEIVTRKKPTKIFWCDMTDLFGDWVSFEQIAACFGVMAATPWHTHQVLTKRARRMREFFEWVVAVDPGNAPWTNVHWEALKFEAENHPLGDGGPVHCKGGGAVADARPWPLPNVHLGVSAEDQANADARWAELRRCPAAVRWISAEPLLGPISGCDLIAPRALVDGYREVQQRFPSPLPTPPHLGAPGIDWIVVGGESGDRARPFDVDWARQIVRMGKEANIPVFCKQLGANPFDSTGAWESRDVLPTHGPDISEWGEDFTAREFPR